MGGFAPAPRTSLRSAPTSSQPARFGGLVGQAIAGLASLGAVFLAQRVRAVDQSLRRGRSGDSVPRRRRGAGGGVATPQHSGRPVVVGVIPTIRKTRPSYNALTPTLHPAPLDRIEPVGAWRPSRSGAWRRVPRRRPLTPSSAPGVDRCPQRGCAREAGGAALTIGPAVCEGTISAAVTGSTSAGAARDGDHGVRGGHRDFPVTLADPARHIPRLAARRRHHGRNALPRTTQTKPGPRQRPRTACAEPLSVRRHTHQPCNESLSHGRHRAHRRASPVQVSETPRKIRYPRKVMEARAQRVSERCATARNQPAGRQRRRATNT